MSEDIIQTKHVCTTVAGMYWCGAKIGHEDVFVTADGAMFTLARGEGALCGDCLRAIALFIDENVDAEPASKQVDMQENLARVAINGSLEAIGRFLRDLGEELRQPLSRVEWRDVYRSLGWMEVQLRTARDVTQICSVIYDHDKGS